MVTVGRTSLTVDDELQILGMPFSEDTLHFYYSCVKLDRTTEEVVGLHFKKIKAFHFRAD